MKIGVIGDLHMKDSLSYADYISDGRKSEKKAVLDTIVDSFNDCSHIVFMGDNFNSKNNSSETNREFVELLERFGDKELYIISGNHERKGDGSTAIDFLAEVKKDNWHVYTDKPKHVMMGQLPVVFAPFILPGELGVEKVEEATEEMMYKLKKADILFTHHMISGTVFNGMKTDDAKEIVLPQEELSKKYNLVVAGHIHSAQKYNKVLITGNVFTTEVGDDVKSVWKINDKDLSIEQIDLPGRPILKLTNPTEQILATIPVGAILKVTVTDKKVDVEKLKKLLSRFDASLVIEDYPDTRKKMHIEDGAMDFSIESLLGLYAKERDVDLQKLLKGLELIK